VVRLGLCVLAAVLVGAFFFAVKGDGTDPLRYVVGNLAAPWLIVPFAGGRTVRQPLGGAIVGAVLAVVSLTAFYGILDLLTHSLSVHVMANYLLFFSAGAVVGGATGVLGALSRRHLTWWLALGLPALFVLEPLAAFAVRFSGGRTGVNIAVWAVELVLGVVSFGAVLWFRARLATGVDQQAPVRLDDRRVPVDPAGPGS
jgi:hypothetical protein